ncbi:NAD-dependent epimerase/dehydratase family protein [Cellulomonas sp. NPDC089187]|uniref:NAD-dependent epimerase/dehydratase family protein n=1 Tax=Cellulomonas sp. NPDC089187 TaxID=3154970 RepID=UPI003433C0BE
MRVAVVGASGNVGTAVLRRLRADESVTSVVALARRVPHTTPPPPYDRAEWRPVDLAAGGPQDRTVEHLRRAFAGADAVVHLAWAIQPSHDRDRLRRVNVEGTRRVIEAAVQAGVPHLVVVSSVGAYAPAFDDRLRDEDWPTEGIATADYSQDKVAQERLLDELELRHTGIRVARVRPALVFQHAAGPEVKRIFLGPFVPRRLLDGNLPVLPWPEGLRVQAIHGDDLADGIREVVVRQATGAFNLAGAGVIRAADVAEVLAQGNWREVPHGPVRQALWAAWQLRLAPIGPGWFDLAAGAPLLDTARAERELGFRPRWTSVAAMRDLLDGMMRSPGTASPPLKR